MKTEGPLLSVIVPVFNAQSYVSECVESLIEQTVDDFEIILVDDGSTDSSPELCDGFAVTYDNVRVIHLENGGLSVARNTGLERARGEWICFVDSDDSAAPGMLETLLAVARENGVKLSSISFEGSGTGALRMLSSSEAIMHVLKEDDPFTTSAWGKLFHRSLFDGIRFPEGTVYEDYYTVPRIIDKAERIAHRDEILYHYRLDNSDSVTHSQFSERRLEYFAVADEIDIFLKEKYPEFLRYSDTRRTRYAISFFKQAAQSPDAGSDSVDFLVKQVRGGIWRYLFSSYKLTSKGYGLLIAACPSLAVRVFKRK